MILYFEVSKFNLFFNRCFQWFQSHGWSVEWDKLLKWSMELSWHRAVQRNDTYMINPFFTHKNIFKHYNDFRLILPIYIYCMVSIILMNDISCRSAVVFDVKLALLSTIPGWQDWLRFVNTVRVISLIIFSGLSLNF